MRGPERRWLGVLQGPWPRPHQFWRHLCPRRRRRPPRLPRPLRHLPSRRPEQRRPEQQPGSPGDSLAVAAVGAPEEDQEFSARGVEGGQGCGARRDVWSWLSLREDRPNCLARHLAILHDFTGPPFNEFRISSAFETSKELSRFRQAARV